MFQTLSYIVRPVSIFLSADELFPKGACAAISVAMPNLKLAIWKLSLFNRSSAALAKVALFKSWILSDFFSLDIVPDPSHFGDSIRPNNL